MTNKSLRILLDIGHPAHVHFFKNAMKTWKNRGHSLAITIRDKDITSKLLDIYGFQYTVASKARKGTIGLAFELIQHDLVVLKAAMRHKSQILIGTSVAITHASRVLGSKSIVFGEDDAHIAPTFTRLAYPLAHMIVTPDCLNENHGSKHITYRGYQKLAYLHPNVFIPNPSVLNKMGLLIGEPYFILRFVNLDAAHDRGEAGISLKMQKRLVDALSQRGSVFITSEGRLSQEFDIYRLSIPPTDIHHAMAFATLMISDSQTMTVEAAILGTPAIRCNTFVGRISVLEELEHRYQLTYGFLPEDEEKMFSFIMNLLDQPNLSEIWHQRREKMLAEKIDVNAWMVEFVESYTTTHS
jgi:uncharacterized protein